MRSILVVCALVSALAGAAQAQGGADPASAPGVDRYGDPLPRHALARLGTSRLRHSTLATCAAFSPDGQFVASADWGSELRLWNLRSGRLEREWSTESETYGLAFSPDAQRLARVGGRGRVEVYDVNTGELHWSTDRHRDVNGGFERVEGAAFSPDNVSLATVAQDGTVRLWDAVTGHELLRLQCGEPSASEYRIAFSGTGGRIAAATRAEIRIWNLDQGGEPLVVEEPHGEFATPELAFVDDEKLVSAGLRPDENSNETPPPLLAESKLWDAASGKLLETIARSPAGESVAAVAVNPERTRLAIISGVDVSLRELPSLRELRSVKLAIDAPSQWYSAALSAGGMWLTTPAQQSIGLWDLESGKPRFPHEATHDSRVCDLLWTSEGRQIISGGYDGSIVVWDVAETKPVKTLRFPVSDRSGGVHVLAMSPDGSVLAAGGYDTDTERIRGAVRLWKLPDFSELARLDVGPRVNSLAFTANGSRLAIGAGSAMNFDDVDPDAKLLLWDWDAPTAAWSTKTGAGLSWIECAADSEVRGLDELAQWRAWSAADGQPQGEAITLANIQRGIQSVAHSPARSEVAIQEKFSHHIELRSTADSGEGLTLDRGKSLAGVTAYSPDGKFLFVGTRRLSRPDKPYESQSAIYDSATGALVRQFDLGCSPTCSAKFSPDGSRLATGLSDGTVLIWDVAALRGDSNSSDAPGAVTEASTP